MFGLPGSPSCRAAEGLVLLLLLAMAATPLLAEELPNPLLRPSIRQSTGRIRSYPLRDLGLPWSVRLGNATMGRAWVDDGMLHVRGTACGRSHLLLRDEKGRTRRLPLLFVPPLTLSLPERGLHGERLLVEATGGIPPYHVELEGPLPSRIEARSATSWELRLGRPGRLALVLRDGEAQELRKTLCIGEAPRGEAETFRVRCDDSQVTPGQTVMARLEGGHPPYRFEERGRWRPLSRDHHPVTVPDAPSLAGRALRFSFRDARGKAAVLHLQVVAAGPLRARLDRDRPLVPQRSLTCEILGGRLPLRVIRVSTPHLVVTPMGARRFTVGYRKPRRRGGRPLAFTIRDRRGRRLTIEVPTCP